MLESKTSRITSNILAIAALLVFMSLALSAVWSNGVCCGDDAYLSTIAKNLANGLGYVSTIQAFTPHYIIRPFDPTDGTGPTIILPAALFIKIFGNVYWAPGLANVTFWSLLFVLVGYFARKYNYGIGFSLFAMLFLYLNYALMTFHYEHWYALLGEAPSALLIILGILCFLYRDTRFYQFLTGILFSLAVESKLLSVVPCFGFLIAYGFTYYRKPSEDDQHSFLKFFFRRALFVGFGFLLPLFLFELWKFIVLGPINFWQNWQEYLGFIRATSTQPDQPSSLAMLYNQRAAVLVDRFSISLPIVAGMLIAGWLLIKKDANLKRLYIVFVIIITIYSTYWVFMSNGRARYFIICLILLNFLLSLPLLSSRPKEYIFLYLILLFVMTFNTWERLYFPFSTGNGQFFTPTIKTQALIEMSKTLSEKTQTIDSEHITATTQWWATAADVEYLMDTSHNFTTFRDRSLLNGKSFMVVVNTLFLDKNDKDFNDLIASCKNVQKIDVYMIATCSYKNLK